MNKNDLRYIKTHQLIIDTFLKCVDEIGFEKTTVSIICEKALISRKAFYAHFEDKYILLKYIYNDLKEKYIQSLSNELLQQITTYDLRDAVNWNIRNAAKNHDLIRILLKIPNGELREVLIDAVAIYPYHLLLENYEEIAKDVKLQIMFRYMTTAMIGFFEVWLNHFDEITLEEAEELMYELCYSISKQYGEKVLNHPLAKFQY